MKAITIWNPYPYLIGYGHKHNETRSWATDYRGKIAIHSAKKNDKKIELLKLNLLQFFSGNKAIQDVLTMQQQHGAVICTAYLTDCILIDEKFLKSLSKIEYVLGNYEIGRYAWKLENVHMLAEPVPAKGQQRLWNWKGDCDYGVQGS